MPWKVVNEDDDVALGEGRRNGRDMTGKRVLKWLASLEKHSIDKLKSIEFIHTYGCVNHMYELKCLVELAQSRKKKMVESRPTGISYTIKKDKGKAKEVCQPMLKEKQKAIEEFTKKVIADVKGVLTFEDKPKLDYKINQAPWSRQEVPPREGLNDWKVDLINSIRTAAPQGIDEVNTPKLTKRVQSKYPQFNVQRTQSLNALGPNTSGPYKQTNLPEFFQPKKNSTVKPSSSHPGITWVNLGTMGWVTHTKENPVWNIDGYCYLVAINLKGLRNREWPKYLTLYTMSHFHYKYRKYAGFKVYTTTNDKYHLELDLACKLGEGWTEIDCLAKEGLT